MREMDPVSRRTKVSHHVKSLVKLCSALKCHIGVKINYFKKAVTLRRGLLIIRILATVIMRMLRNSEFCCDGTLFIAVNTREI